jgi:Fe-S oxidoreductase
MLSSTDTVGKIAGIPVLNGVVNTVNQIKPVRKVMDKVMGIHADAHLPRFESKPLRSRLADRRNSQATGTPTATTKGRVALFSTCYGNRNEPHIGEDLVAVFEHNGIPVTIAEKEQCCGMPKLELGDLESVAAAKDVNIPALVKLVNEGWDIVAPVPSCALMFRQELPLLFPEDADVRKVADAIFDPFEYLMLRHKEGQLKTDFKNSLGKVSYHAACHQRVQNFGAKTKDALSLVPDTKVEMIERCSGHDGTYGVKSETFEKAMKIARPVVNKIKQAQPDHYGSDCPIAGHHLANSLKDGSNPEHPMSLLRKAYGI